MSFVFTKHDTFLLRNIYSFFKPGIRQLSYDFKLMQKYN